MPIFLAYSQPLKKAHISAYQRVDSTTGQSVNVKEHEDKRPAARVTATMGREMGTSDVLAQLRLAGTYLNRIGRGLGAPLLPDHKEPVNALEEQGQPGQGQQQPGTENKPGAQQKPRPSALDMPPQAYAAAMALLQSGGKIGMVMQTYEKLSPLEKEIIDRWLVVSNHPLKDEPGTSKDRFEAWLHQRVAQTKAREEQRKQEEAKEKKTPDQRPPVEKFAEAAKVVEQQRQEESPEAQAAREAAEKERSAFVEGLDKKPDGTAFVIPVASARSHMQGTWKKVTIGGEHFWKKGNVYRPSRDFGTFQTSIARQLAEASRKPIKAADKRVVLARDVQKPATATTGSAPTAATFTIPTEQQGKTVNAHTEQGTTVQVQYAVVEADTPIASHDTQFQANPDFPKELQPRDRSRAASEAQIQGILANFQPELLGANPKASDGAPVIGPDGAVEIGNGRTIALRRAFEQRLPEAKKYTSWLADNAQEFGLDVDKIRDMKQPMLVRMRKTDVDRQAFTKETNIAGQEEYSDAEQARIDAKALSPELLANYDPHAEGGEKATENLAFARGFARGLPRLGKFITDEGRLSQSGATRVRNALLARAFDNPKVVEKISEATDDNTRNLSNALVSVAPRIAAQKGAIEAGNLHDLDISKDIGDAAVVYGRLRQEKMTVADYINQEKMFGEELSPLGITALSVFERYARQPSKIRQFFHEYADVVEAAGSPKESAGLFGKKEAPTKAELVERATTRTELQSYEPKRRKEGLFASFGRRVRGLFLRKSKDLSYEEETAVIQENKKKPEARQRHKFKRARWPHPNMHPRCLTCGDEPGPSEYCEGIRKLQEGEVAKAGPVSLDQLREAAARGGAPSLSIPKLAAKYHKERRITWRGVPITIENPKGSLRHWEDDKGNPRTSEMQYNYGEVPGTVGMDDDPLDVVLGANLDAPTVYVITISFRPTYDRPDETKSFIGFTSENDALCATLLMYDDPRIVFEVNQYAASHYAAELMRLREGKGGTLLQRGLFLACDLEKAVTNRDGHWRSVWQVPGKREGRGKSDHV